MRALEEREAKTAKELRKSPAQRHSVMCNWDLGAIIV
jgi:hypothetical protein